MKSSVNLWFQCIDLFCKHTHLFFSTLALSAGSSRVRVVETFTNKMFTQSLAVQSKFTVKKKSFRSLILDLLLIYYQLLGLELIAVTAQGISDSQVFHHFQASSAQNLLVLTIQIGHIPALFPNYIFYPLSLTKKKKKKVPRKGTLQTIKR